MRCLVVKPCYQPMSWGGPARSYRSGEVVEWNFRLPDADEKKDELGRWPEGVSPMPSSFRPLSSSEADPIKGSPTRVSSTEELDLHLALSKLDSENDDHWTAEGLPRVDKVIMFLGRETDRGAIKVAAPALTRQTAL